MFAETEVTMCTIDIPVRVRVQVPKVYFLIVHERMYRNIKGINIIMQGNCPGINNVKRL